ncbi:MAG: glucosamine-6-phosphate deaminase [Promethearchaeota archaeon]
MKITIVPTKREVGSEAAKKAEELLLQVLKSKQTARFVAATGVSQFDFLRELCALTAVPWARTEMFHLDEYIGLSGDHPASFRYYLKERLVKKIHPSKVYFIQGDAPDPKKECERLNHLISQYPIDITFLGIGENGHLAFNDPPADFNTKDPYIIVNLDEKCRKQQVGEGWFQNLEEVPTRAISMSITQILKSTFIICIVPEKRKAQAVRDCLSPRAPISPWHPASILKTHPNAWVFLDEESASLLET